MAAFPYAKIADAVVTKLNSLTFSPALTAVKRYSPIFSKTALSSPKCSVILGEVENEITTFGLPEQWTVTVWVVVQKNVNPEISSEVDALVSLPFDIYEALKRLELNITGGAVAQWISSEVDAAFDAAAIADGNYFGAVSVKYRIGA